MRLTELGHHLETVASKGVLRHENVLAFYVGARSVGCAWILAAQNEVTIMAGQVADADLVQLGRLNRHGQQTLTRNGDETDNSKTDREYFADELSLVTGVVDATNTQVLLNGWNRSVTLDVYGWRSTDRAPWERR